jgi:hypothetical protein
MGSLNFTTMSSLETFDAKAEIAKMKISKVERDRLQKEVVGTLTAEIRVAKKRRQAKVKEAGECLKENRADTIVDDIYLLKKQMRIIHQDENNTIKNDIDLLKRQMRNIHRGKHKVKSQGSERPEKTKAGENKSGRSSSVTVCVN